MTLDAVQGTRVVRCITLWQPWASAIAKGAKLIETRWRGTEIRGLVAIHAAMRRPVGLSELAAANRAAYDALDGIQRDRLGWMFEGRMPTGCVVGVARLHASCAAGDAKPSALERLLGDYGPNRHAWTFSHTAELPTPAPARGYQGWFEWRPDAKVCDWISAAEAAWATGRTHYS